MTRAERLALPRAARVQRVRWWKREQAARQARAVTRLDVRAAEAVAASAAIAVCQREKAKRDKREATRMQALLAEARETFERESTGSFYAAQRARRQA